MLTQILPSLFYGCIETLKVFFVTLLVSLPLSLTLASLQKVGNKLFSWILEIIIYVERGTPLMLQLMFVYFGLPYIGLTLDRETAILVAFILNYTAYMVEVFRGGILSVSDGQFEAAKALGLSFPQMYFHIILPQAMKSALPAFTNEVLNLIKDTSLITVLGAAELLKAGRTAVNTYASALPFVYVGIFYLVMTGLTSVTMKTVEAQIRW